MMNGLGIAIVSTSHGVMTDPQGARDRPVGGEVICIVAEMEHSSTLGWTFLVLRTRVFSVGAARRAHALAAPLGTALND